MITHVKQRLAQRHWKIAVGVLLVLTAFAVYEGVLGLLAFLGVPALIIAAACLIPCLAPIAWLRRKQNQKPEEY